MSNLNKTALKLRALVTKTWGVIKIATLATIKFFARLGRVIWRAIAWTWRQSLQLVLAVYRKLLLVTLRTRNILKYKVLPKFTAIRIGIVVIVAISAIILLYDSSYTGFYFQMPTDESSLFYTIAGMSGAMLAIVLAFSTQLTARTSEELPTRYFWLFARDKLLDTYYLLIATITIIELGLGLTINDIDGSTRTMHIKIGMTLSLWALLLLYMSYRRLIRIMSHDHLVSRVVKRNKKEIDEINRLARKSARINTAGRKLTKEQKLAVQASAYGQMAKRIRALNHEVEGLVELHNLYLRKDDKYASANFFHAAAALVMGYVYSRKDTAVLTPSRNSPLTAESDLSGFLLSSLETLKPVWDAAIKNNDVPIIRSYLRNIQDIARVTLHIEHVGRNNTNPAYSTVDYHLGVIIGEAISARNIDALFEITSVLEQIAEIACKQSYFADPMDQVFEQFQKIANVSLSDEKMDAVSYSLLQNLETIIHREFAQEKVNEGRLKALSKITTVIITGSALSPYTNTLTKSLIADLGDRILPVAMQKMQDTPTERDARQLVLVSRFILTVAESLTSVTHGDNYETQAFNKALVSATHDLYKMLDNEAIREQCKVDITGVLYDISVISRKLKPLNEMRDTNDIEDLIDRLVQMALIAIDNHDQETAQRIFDMVLNYLRKAIDPELKLDGHFIQDLLRMINRLKLIGAAARSKGMRGLQKHTADSIYHFQNEYIAKIFPEGVQPNTISIPRPDILKSGKESTYHLHQTGLPNYFKNAFGTFFDSYSDQDYEKYEEYIWRDR